MRKQLETKALIIWAMFMCIFWVGVSNATELTPKMSGEQLMCIIIGGKWIDNVCVKSAEVKTRVSKCNPLICLITWDGKRINSECVKQDTEPGQMPSSTTPRH